MIFKCCNKNTTPMNKSQDDNTQNFGEFIRQRRIKLGFTLRSFCNRFDFDPAYISRLERNLLPPPENKDKLEGLAKALNIEKGTVDWVNFFDMSYIAKGEIPQDILNKTRSERYLPLLFRTARGKKLSKKKLQELVKLINGS